MKRRRWFIPSSEEIEARKRQIKRSLYLLKKTPTSIVGLVIISFYLIIALIAPYLAPPTSWDPYHIPTIPSMEPQPPDQKHPFGTGQYGIDILYGVIWGSRSCFQIAITVVAIALSIGIPLGVVSGYYRGVTDELIMRITDIFLSLPSIVLAMAFAAVLGPGLGNLSIALALIWWPRYARLMRGEVLAVRVKDYVRAAKAMGSSSFRIISKHIIPNSIQSLIVVASIDLGTVILFAAGMSFIGLGAPPGTAEWGALLNASRDWISQGKWWTFLFPGAAIFLYVMGWNLIGDAFGDLLDPRVQR